MPSRDETLETLPSAHESTGQVFRFAIVRGLASRNPAADFRPSDILAEVRSQNFARVEVRDLSELLVRMDEYKTFAMYAGAVIRLGV